MNVDLNLLECPFCKTLHPKIRYKYENCAIVKCQKCGLMWLFPRPEENQLYEVYGDIKYYFNQDFFSKGDSKIYGYVDYLAERINKQYWYKKIIQKTKAIIQTESSSEEKKYRWLDVGCGLGFCMDVAYDYGFDVSGIEFNLPAVEYIRAKYTFPVEYGRLNEIQFSRQYDVVSMFDVIEHLTDPIADLCKLREVVSDHGCLLIQTMDSESFVSRLLGKRLEDFRRFREHLFFFSRDSLKQILEHCGWEVYEMRSIGQTFQVSALVDRFAVYSKFLSKFIRGMIHPKWLLEANIYVNPGTKMMIYARPKRKKIE